ncbi:MAG: MAPEG family protein [Polyangiaceae bacterium]
MSPLAHNPALAAYAVACVALVGIFFFLAMQTGSVRSRARAVVNPEDPRVYKGASVVEVEHPDVQRVKRAHLNLIENTVPFFAVGYLFALTEPGLVLASILYGIFVFARVVHAYVYLTARQPVRSGAWMAGLLVVVVMAVAVLRSIAINL